MVKRTLYITQPFHLALQRQQIVLQSREKSQTPTTLPSEDIGYLVLENREITLTQALISHCVAQNIAIITCDEKMMPSAFLLPLDAHFLPQGRATLQVEATPVLKKQLWQQVIEAKIGQQAHLIRHLERDAKGIFRLANEVKSGDSTNREASAARVYWKLLFGDDFIRDRYGEPPNNALNYGYAILRAAVARAIVGHGLMPVLGIFHHNQNNAFCLADDLMEPYRPFVDRLVWEMHTSGDVDDTLTTKQKQTILKILTHDALMPNGDVTPLMLAIDRSVYRFVRCLEKEEKKLIFGTLNFEQ